MGGKSDISFIALTLGVLGIITLGIIAIIVISKKDEVTAPQYVVPVEHHAQMPVEREDGREYIKTAEVEPSLSHIINHIVSQNVWASIPIPSDISVWAMKSRNQRLLYYSFDPSHATYSSVYAGMVLTSSTAPDKTREIYVMSPNGNDTIELELWKYGRD